MLNTSTHNHKLLITNKQFFSLTKSTQIMNKKNPISINNFLVKRSQQQQLHPNLSTGFNRLTKTTKNTNRKIHS